MTHQPRHRWFIILALLALPTACAACATMGTAQQEGSPDHDLARALELGELVPRSECAAIVEHDRATQAMEAGVTQIGNQEPAGAPLQPMQIVSEEVSFESLGATLQGTIERPAAIPPARLPAIVIVHDRGPIARDGLMGGAVGVDLPVEVAVYAEIARHLAARGFLVLRYDKRTCAGGGPASCTYPRAYVDDHRQDLAQALVADAQAAVRHLAARHEVDPRQVSVIGHGEGAEVALAMLADDDLHLASLILLTPSPYPVDELVLHQTMISIEHLRERLGGPQANSAMGDLLKTQLLALTNTHAMMQSEFGNLRREGATAEVMGIPASTWSAYFALHKQAIDRLAKDSPPILAVFAARDFDLPADSSTEFASLLGAAPDRHLRVLPNLTHLLVSVGEEDDITRVSDDLQDAIFDFLGQH